MAPVTGAFGASPDEVSGDTVAVFSQSQDTHEVNEAGGKVQLAAKLTGGVVIWKGVVVVMESFT